MCKAVLSSTISIALALGAACLAQSAPKISIPGTKTAPANGSQMYAAYCAPCHGIDGRGHGPVAPALKVQPADLTALSRTNHGKFPDAHVIAILNFGTPTPAHGSAQMPVWGPILSRMDSPVAQQKLLRIANLTRYLQTIQVK